MSRTEWPLSVSLGCCALLLLYAAGCVVATVVAITDLVGQRTHLGLDIVLLLLFGVPLLRTQFRVGK